MRSSRVTAAVVALLLIGGCVNVFKPEIQQGNVITQEMIDKLKPGMTKSQVRFVLGTPLINDRFHPERWDYIYVYKRDIGAPPETRQFTVIFDGDTLTRTEGDFTPPPSATASEAAGALVNREPPASSTSARSL
jgi:outer membrane protein assembly factor BamE